MASYVTIRNNGFCFLRNFGWSPKNTKLGELKFLPFRPMDRYFCKVILGQSYDTSKVTDWSYTLNY